MPTITSANAILLLSVNQLFAVPQKIQGFASDDVYSVDPLEAAETMMGVDGILSGGWVNTPKRIGYALQADSPSMSFFETWYGAQQQIQDLYYANGTISLPSLAKKFTLTKGILTTFPIAADAGRTLRPRKFTIVWESMIPSPL